jgi:hypothetical protein
MEKYHANFDQLDPFSQVKNISIPDQEFLPSVVDYYNYEYMTFLYVVHVYMLCNVVLYCISLPTDHGQDII